MIGLGRREPVNNRLKELGLLNIIEIHKLNCCIYVLKSMQSNGGTFNTIDCISEILGRAP